MSRKPQFERYHKLRRFIDDNFKEEINIDIIEAVSHYSYRNINRIFLALHHETIGRYIKRIRLEKAAEYLKYSDLNISDIAFEVGFSEIAVFSKAFKNKFNCSPTAFRSSQQLIQKIIQQELEADGHLDFQKQQFEIEVLPEFNILYLEHRGAYDNIPAIKACWDQLDQYATKENLLSDDTIFLAEILDDNEISESIHCRYHAAIILKNADTFTPAGLFEIKKIPRQKYSKFIHRGAHETSSDTYTQIYAHWINDLQLELADLPTLEFFLNDETDTAPEDLLTEIYIPIL